MKVKCIKPDDGLWNVVPEAYTTSGSLWWKKKKRATRKGPKKGDILTVVGEYWKEGEKFYELMEWPPYGYSSTSFKPIDEVYEKITTEQIKEKASAN